MGTLAGMLIHTLKVKWAQLQVPRKAEGQESRGGSGPGRPGRAEGGAAAHLGLGEHQGGGHLEAFGPRQVLVQLELMLQLEQLLAGEGGAWPAALPQEAGLRLGCGGRGS